MNAFEPSEELLQHKATLEATLRFLQQNAEQNDKLVAICDELISANTRLERSCAYWQRRYSRATSESLDDLLIDFEQQARSLEEEKLATAREKERRVYWQNLAYVGMRLVDRLNSRKLSRGEGCTEDTFEDAANLVGLRYRRDQWDVSRAEELLQAMADLRSEEGDSVTLCADNAEFDGPAARVVCNGAWTGWNDEDFTGDSLIDAMHAAVKIRETRTPENYPAHREIVGPQMLPFKRFGKVFEPEKLLWCLVKNAMRLAGERPTWSVVADWAGLGSTSAKKLCLAVGCCPDTGVDLADLPEPHPLLAAYDEDDVDDVDAEEAS